MQGRADGRAARVNETSSHTLAKRFCSLRNATTSKMMLRRKWRVIAME